MTAALDALWRSSLRVAYRTLRVWWAIRRPATDGAYVAVWREDRLLLVRNSYRPGESVPAGRIRRGEAPVVGAARELLEEVGIAVDPEELIAAGTYVVEFEDKTDHAHFFELRVAARTEARIDRREVVHAEWVSEAELQGRPLLPHTRVYLEQRLRAGAPARRD